MNTELLLLAGLAWLVTRPKQPSRPPAAAPKQGPVQQAPVARIYKGPNDAYEVVRMSVQLPGKPFEEMGIFTNQAAAMNVAKDLGYRVIPAANEGIELVNGKSYEASIKLVGLEATFGTASAVKNKLSNAGFSNVVVTDNKGGNFIARGTWGKATMTAKLPSQVKDVRAL